LSVATVSVPLVYRSFWIEALLQLAAAAPVLDLVPLPDPLPLVVLPHAASPAPAPAPRQ
jgi:hypothetical protein